MTRNCPEEYGETHLKQEYSELHSKLEILKKYRVTHVKQEEFIYDTRLFEIPIEYSVVCRFWK